MKNIVYILLLISLISCDLFQNTHDSPETQMKLLWKVEYLALGFGPLGGPFPIGDSLVAWTGDSNFNISRISDGQSYMHTLISTEANMASKYFYLAGDMILGFHFHDLWCWSISEKNLLWKYEFPSYYYNPGYKCSNIDDEKLIVGGRHEISLINLSGNLADKIQINFTSSSMVHANGRIYCGFFIPDQGIDSGWITCYDAVTHDSLWAFHTDKGGFSSLSMRPTVENGILYASATGGPDSKGLLVALNAETGEVIWEQRDIGPIGSAKKAFIDGDVIYGSANLGPFAVNKNTGDVIWFTNVADQVGCCENMPALLNGIMYHVQGNGLFIIDASSGEILEHIYHDSENYWYVSASSNRVFLQTAYAVYCHEPYKR